MTLHKAEPSERATVTIDYDNIAAVGTIMGTLLALLVKGSIVDFEVVSNEPLSTCKHCKAEVRRVPGGHGPTWVHDETGTVAG